MNRLVIVDFQNLKDACERKEVSIKKVLEQILSWRNEEGGIFEIRLFVPGYQDASRWSELNVLQMRYGLSIEVCPVLRKQTGRWKDLVDFYILLWVTKFVVPGSEPKAIKFVTGDGDMSLAANEALRRGKEVEFWPLEESGTTSAALIRNFTVREIELPDKSKGLMLDDNPFVNALAAASKEVAPDLDVQQRVALLSRVVKEVLMRKPLSFQEHIEALGISSDDARKIARALLFAGVAKIFPETTLELEPETESVLYEWLLSYS